MTLYVLRAKWKEYHSDSDEGETFVCDTYDDIAFSEDLNKLINIKYDLVIGDKDEKGYWNEQRAKLMRKLWPAYDGFLDVQYDIDEITELMV